VKLNPSQDERHPSRFSIGQVVCATERTGIEAITRACTGKHFSNLNKSVTVLPDRIIHRTTTAFYTVSSNISLVSEHFMR
jgi:hypothetical protein